MEIQKVVNIGPLLAADLRNAGIDSLEKLQMLGYREAWLRIQAVNPERDCTHALLALAGNVAGIRWAKLPADVRESIKHDALHEKAES